MDVTTFHRLSDGNLPWAFSSGGIEVNDLLLEFFPWGGIRRRSGTRVFDCRGRVP